jgi:hypothetical protein
MAKRTSAGRRVHSSTCVVLALLLGSCDVFEIDAPVYERVIGAIQSSDAPLGVQVEDTVNAGTAFLVRVRTYGGGCTRGGDTEVRLSESPGLTAELIPYNFEAVRHPPNSSCHDITTEHIHDAFITFTRPGEARITVRGRGDVTVVRTVVVTSAR